MSNLNQAINSWIESLHCYIKGFPAEIVPLMNLENDMKKFLESEPEPTGLSAKIRKFAVMYENELPRRAEIALLFESCKEIDRLKDELVCEECEKSLEDPETGVTAFCMACWNAMITKLRAEIEAKDAALEKLARLGNEPYLGNSEGNIIAQQALKGE